MVIASLFTGIEINDFFYKNIHIKKLYLKYDKKLNISSPEITIYDINPKKTTKIDLNFTVGYHNQEFKIDITQLKIINTDISFSGLISINQKKIDLEKKSEFIIEDANLTFDKNMEQIDAKKIFVSYENDIFDLLFERPYYGDIDIEGTKVSFVQNKNILKLFLHTNSLLNDTLKKALLNYDIEIPVEQYSGTNNIMAKIFIPFGKGDLFVESNINIKNSSLNLLGQDLNASKIALNFKNNTLQGILHLQEYKYQEFIFSDTILNYDFSFQNELNAKITSDKINATFNTQQFSLNNLTFDFEKNQIKMFTKIKDSKKQVLIDLNNTTNLDTNNTYGVLNVLYENNETNISVKSDTINYKGDFTKELRFDVESDFINLQKPPYKATISDIKMHLENNILRTSFYLKDSIRSINSQIFNTTDFTEKISTGTVLLHKINFENFINLTNTDIPYIISFEDNVSVDIPYFGLNYFKEKNTKIDTIKIEKPYKIIDAISFLSHKNNNTASITIISKDLNDTTIDINALNVVIDSDYFQSKNENNTSKIERLVVPNFPKMKLKYTNSSINYDKYSLIFDTLNLDTNSTTAKIKIIKDKSIIEAHIIDNGLIFNAKNLTDTYMNSFLNQKIFENGYMNLNIYGEDINELSGDVNFHTTTIRNVTIINSLLTFVNTTPAILNPLLALPTLFRMAETGFDTNGYYMKNGDGSFRYNVPLKELGIYDIYSNGKMSNFIVNSHVNFKTNTIDANVDISFLKDFSKVIRSIPIVGYIVMGEDGEFHTSIDISGKLDDPQMETHTLESASNGVTGIIKRILTLPFNIVDINTSEEQKEEHEKRVKELIK